MPAHRAPSAKSKAHPPSLTPPPPQNAVSDDHRRLGWVVVDIRTMKQNALEYGPEGDNSGVWLDLQSPTFKTDKGESSPCIRVFATLREAPVRSTGSGLAKTAGGSLSDSVAVSDAPEYDHGISPRSSLENAAHNSAANRLQIHANAAHKLTMDTSPAQWIN